MRLRPIIDTLGAIPIPFLNRHLTMTNDTYPNLYHLVQERYSCRSFSSREVSRDIIKAIVDVARLAPSACNRQPWKFLVADTTAGREAVMASYPRPWMASAPVFIVACGLHNEGWHRGADSKDHTDIDVAIAVEHICLGAAALGLGSCWVCNFDAAPLKETFAIPDEAEPIAIIPLGYPVEGSVAPEKNRKSLDEILKWGSY